jgi:hypothetical protein
MAARFLGLIFGLNLSRFLVWVPAVGGQWPACFGILMLFRLIVLTGPLSGQRVTVEKAPMTFGRDADCTVRLDDEEVARKHAVLEHRADGLVIRDLGSMNRILVNKREVRESKLKHGDVFELGLTRFLVQVHVQAEVEPAPAEAPSPEFERRSPWKAVAFTVLVILGVAAFYVFTLYPALQSKPPVDEFARAEPIEPEPQPVAEVQPEPPVAVEEAPAPVTEAASIPAVSNQVAEAAPVGEEIRAMREELQTIRDAVKSLATKDEPAPMAPLPPAGPAGELSRVETMLFEARGKVEAGQMLEAEQILNSILILDPGYLPAMRERALLYEKLGRMKKAMDQWGEIAARVPGTPEHDDAVAQRLRVAELERSGEGAAAGVLVIQSVEQQKFPESAEFDEMRTLTIGLRPVNDQAVLDPDAVRVEVCFYEKDERSGDVMVSSNNLRTLTLGDGSDWSAASPVNLTATYVIPKGRQELQEDGTPAHVFHGFRVDVLYRGVLQDQVARPKTLIQQEEETRHVESDEESTNRLSITNSTRQPS